MRETNQQHMKQEDDATLIARPELSSRAWLALSYWLGGAAIALCLAAARGAIDDPPVVYHRRLDLASDIDWLDAWMPPELLSRFVLESGFQNWRLDGTKQVEARLGEESTTLTFYRRTPASIDRSPEGTGRAVRLRRGWPLACAEGSAWQAPLSGDRWRRRLWVVGEGTPRPIAVPLQILWLGLAADAAVFGAALWMLREVPGWAERVVRRRGGRCAQCGHLLAGATRCPECGVEP